jgi:hypothetical protein
LIPKLIPRRRASLTLVLEHYAQFEKKIGNVKTKPWSNMIYSSYTF